MKTIDKLLSVKAILECKLFKKRVPLGVRWQITNRCTLKCKYCNTWSTERAELSLAQIKSIIEQLSVLGAKRISFSGGEPLLRDDLREIMQFCRLKNIYPEINSNGTLVADRIDLLSGVDFIKFSLDGPQDVHDSLRGENSFAKVIEACEICKKHGVKFGFATTLTKYNINELDFIVSIAEAYDTIVAFQPIVNLKSAVCSFGDLSPSGEEFKRAIDGLICKKKKGNLHVRNSIIGLKHIYNWPDYGKLKCWAGKIFCVIDTNGDLYPCDRVTFDHDLPNCTEVKLQQALSMLPEVSCQGCGFCGTIELNYLMSLKTRILNSIKKIID
ncbi:MAG: radical SAM protein [PVC group bacterium]|nr:radical SAM protein [PVC group bacterium]